MRKLTNFVLVSMLWAAFIASEAHAASSDPGSTSQGVEQLWKQYPLAEATSTPYPEKRASGTGMASAAGHALAKGGRVAVSTPFLSLWAILLVIGLLASNGLIFSRVRLSRRRARRPDARMHLTPTYAHGRFTRDGHTAFEGFVYATGDGPRSDDTMLCVHDRERDSPIWVHRSEIVALQDADTRSLQES